MATFRKGFLDIPSVPSIWPSTLPDTYRPLRHCFLGWAVLFLALLVTSAPLRGANISIAYVGDPGNASVSFVLGRVDYAYRTGTYEVTNSQYAVARPTRSANLAAKKPT